MGLFDWVELGMLGASKTQEKITGDPAEWFENFEKMFPGSFAITIGDALQSFIWGGRHSHVYGDDFKYVLDWEAIEEALISKIPGGGAFLESSAGALLMGLGGNSALIYGLDTSLKYGETVAVKRATSTDITGGPNFLSKLLAGA